MSKIHRECVAPVLIWRITAAIGVLMVLPCVGCGRSDLASVVGKVTYKGQPLKKGYIVMEPSEGRASRGNIREGEIVDLHTYELGDGVRVGNHKVSIISFVRDPVGMEVPPSVIPMRYNNPDTSGLTAVVEAGTTNELLFELKD